MNNNSSGFLFNILAKEVGSLMTVEWIEGLNLNEGSISGILGVWPIPVKILGLLGIVGEKYSCKEHSLK